MRPDGSMRERLQFDVGPVDEGPVSPKCYESQAHEATENLLQNGVGTGRRERPGEDLGVPLPYRAGRARSYH